MVDTLPDSFNLDPEKVREALSERTKVIVPVDIAGYPCNYDELMEILRNERTKTLFKPKTPEQQMLGRIMLMADSAHGFGASYKGKKLGSIADGTAFSFHAVKNLTTAEGGAICLNMPEPFDHDEMYRMLNLMSLHGQSKDALSKMQKGAWRYDVTIPGYKCNMTDIQAAIGLVELSRYDSETLKRRKELCALYDRAFADCAWAITPTFTDENGSETSYHLYQLRIDGASESSRDAIIQFIAERDIAVNVHFIPLPMLTAYRERGYRMEDYPNAFAHYANEISLPLFYNLKDEEVKEVANAVKDAVKAILKK
jgi:dTDP-4-amino-4,6-dideoxygalactose transaminase